MAITLSVEIFPSFGELSQGKIANQTDFLINLPINAPTIVNIEFEKNYNKLINIECNYWKSKKIAGLLAMKFGLRGYNIKISFNRIVPIGYGLSSSSADVIGVIQVFNNYFNMNLSIQDISSLLVEIEPHDPLQYKNCVMYNHIEGELLLNYNYTPQYAIVAIMGDFPVCTLDFNIKNRKTKYDSTFYDKISNQFTQAFAQKDDNYIASLSIESCKQFFKTNQYVLDLELLDKGLKLSNILTNCKGVINCHSGSAIGFIFNKIIDPEEMYSSKEKIENYFSKNAIVYKTTNNTTLMKNGSEH